MPRPPGRDLLALLVVLAIPGGVAAATTCPPGRFLVQGPPLVAGSGTPPAIDAIVIDGELLSVASGCEPVAVRERPTGDGTRVRARWPFCQTGTRRVRLRGIFDPGCTTLTGSFRMRGVPRRRFEAVRSICSDGVLDRGGGEECDDANLAGGDGCEANCTVPSRETGGTLRSALASGAVIEEADVTIVVEPGTPRIRLAVAPTTFSFDLCTARLHVLQGTLQMEFTIGEPDPPTSLGRAVWDAFGGCGAVFSGVTITGTLSDFPSWFDPRGEFVLLYNFGAPCRNVDSRCTITVPAAD